METPVCIARECQGDPTDHMTLKNVPLKVIKTQARCFSVSVFSPVLIIFHLQVGKSPAFSGAGPTAAAPSVGNVASPDLSFFDAYAPPSGPAQTQVLRCIHMIVFPFSSNWKNCNVKPPLNQQCSKVQGEVTPAW